MADTKISALPASTTPLAGTEVLPIVQSSATKQVSVNNMLGVTSWTSPAANSEGNMFLRATDTLAAGVGTQIGLGGKYNASSYFPFGAVAGRKENSTNNNVAGYLSLLTTTSGGTLTERWRVDSAGNLIPLAAAKGVNFTANTPAAGMTSQLLNWYEEGTWTPAFSASGLSGVTPGSNTFGRYTRVGRLVTVVFYIYTTDTFTKGSNPLSITGLPFTSANITGGYATVSLWNATRFDATPPVVGAIPNNSTSIALYSSFNATGAGADPVAVSSANMRSAAGENCNFVGGTATYMV